MNKLTVEDVLKYYVFDQYGFSNSKSGGVYFILMFINNRWHFKIGQTDDFFNNFYQKNQTYKLNLKELYDGKFPKIIPILCLFSNDSKFRKTIEKIIIDKFKKYLSGIISNQNHKSREIFYTKYEIYNEVEKEFLKYKDCDLYYNQKFYIDNFDQITYIDENMCDGFFLNCYLEN